MLRWALAFLILALVAGGLGFFGLEGTLMQFARILFFLFLVVCLIFFIIGISVGKKVM